MRKKTLPTIKDVAREAGVSTATVSHVFNQSRWVSPETSRLVLEAARRLKYRPSAIARSLSTQQTHSIGVVVADVTNPFFASLVRGIEDRLWEHGYQMTVSNTDEQPEKEVFYLKRLFEQRVDGLIITATGINHSIYQDFILHHVPMVFIDRVPPDRLGPVVVADNYAAGYQACRYLLELGHRRIAFVGRNLPLSTVTGRLHGYRQAFRDFGLREDEDIICMSGSSLEEARQANIELLSQADRPTAVMAANHIMTLGLLSAIRILNLHCPDDISVLAFDDHPWAPLFMPPITVVKQPTAEMCQSSVETLLKAINYRFSLAEDDNPGSLALPEDVAIPMELIIRESCAFPRLLEA